MRVVDLREHLDRLGLSVKGNKAALLERLREAVLSSEAEAAPEAEVMAKSDVQEAGDEIASHEVADGIDVGGPRRGSRGFLGFIFGSTQAGSDAAAAEPARVKADAMHEEEKEPVVASEMNDIAIAIDDMKVSDLREELIQRSLSTSGRKADLQARLREALSASPAGGGEPEQEASDAEEGGGEEEADAGLPFESAYYKGELMTGMTVRELKGHLKGLGVTLPGKRLLKAELIEMLMEAAAGGGATLSEQGEEEGERQGGDRKVLEGIDAAAVKGMAVVELR
ncbi:unnamed protein product, partial [Chrysoparadoxa australica]